LRIAGYEACIVQFTMVVV